MSSVLFFSLPSSSSTFHFSSLTAPFQLFVAFSPFLTISSSLSSILLSPCPPSFRMVWLRGEFNLMSARPLTALTCFRLQTHCSSMVCHWNVPQSAGTWAGTVKAAPKLFCHEKAKLLSISHSIHSSALQGTGF